MTTQTFQLDGLTCGHCVAAVTAEITAIAPSAQVAVELGEPSTLTVTDGPGLTDAQVAAALDEAGGYTLHA
jgi:copper chaperone CopZ